MDKNKKKMIEIAEILEGVNMFEAIGILEMVKSGIVSIASSKSMKILLDREKT